SPGRSSRRNRLRDPRHAPGLHFRGAAPCRGSRHRTRSRAMNEPGNNGFEKHFSAVPLVAILRGIAPDEAEAIGEGLTEAGIAVMEVPTSGPEPMQSIARLARRFAGEAAIGAGTVTRIEEAAAVAEAGGGFMVSPNTDPSVIAASRAVGLATMPGFFTPSE